MMVYKNDITGVEHIALLKGDLITNEPVLVRMHALDMMVDILGEQNNIELLESCIRQWRLFPKKVEDLLFIERGQFE